jgi:hypothetical protein
VNLSVFLFLLVTAGETRSRRLLYPDTLLYMPSPLVLGCISPRHRLPPAVPANPIFNPVQTSLICQQGRLRCLGTPTHLKARYGGGYILECDAPDDATSRAALAAFVADKLGGVSAEERHMGRARFLLPRAGRQLAGVLRRLEAARESLGLSAYGVSVPTLEQVFLNVVGEHLQG